MTSKPSSTILAWIASGILAVCAPAPVSAQEGVVLTVRPDGVVVDLREIEGAQRGTRLGFVHDDGERRETGQGVVTDVREGKALVRLAPGAVASEDDAVVLCPVPGQDDRFSQLRARLDEARDASAAPVAGQLKSTLTRRDAAIKKGACYTGDLDREIALLADQLDGSPAQPGPSTDSAAASRPPLPADPRMREGVVPDQSASGAAAPADGGAATASPVTGILDAVTKLAESIGLKKDRPARTSDSSGSSSGSTMGMMPSATAPSDAQTSPAGAPTAQDTAPATPAAPVSSQTARPSATTSAAPVTTATTTTAPKPGAATTGTTASGAAPTRPGTAADQPSWWQTSKGPGPKTPGGSAQGTQPAAGSAPSGSIPGQWWEAKKTTPTKGPLLTLTGRVVDQSGRPVPGAKVAIGETTTEADLLGVFKLENVKPGQHEVTATARGFRGETKTVGLQQSPIAPITFTLRKGGAPLPGAKDSPATHKAAPPRKIGEDRGDQSLENDQ